jgi:hypothetical protein
MQCLLLIYGNEAAIQGMSPDKLGQLVTAYTAYTEALKKDGVYVGSNRLRPVEDARSVRVSGGKPNVVNGPFAETREQLGGYFLIDVPDIKTAQDYAARCPGAAVGTMEVRPVWQM